jgi:hypothetical protein
MALLRLRTTDFSVPSEKTQGRFGALFHGRAACSRTSPLGTFAAFLKKIRRLALDPGDKLEHVGMREQSLRRVELAGQFGFGQQGMNLPMTDAVQQLGFAAPLGFGHEVVRVLFSRGNVTPAQRAARQSLRLHRQSLRPPLLPFDFAQHDGPSLQRDPAHAGAN